MLTPKHYLQKRLTLTNTLIALVAIVILGCCPAVNLAASTNVHIETASNNGAGPYPSVVLTVVNDTSFVPSTVSQGEVSVCIKETGGYGGWTDSIQQIPLGQSKAIVVTPGVYQVYSVMTVINSFDGTFYEPCLASMNPELVYLNQKIKIKNDNTNWVLLFGGDELKPTMKLNQVKNISEQSNAQGVFSPWQLSGSSVSPVSSANLGDQMFQAIRGTDNNIYTRTSQNGTNFSQWSPFGATLEKVSMVRFYDRLFQAVRGTDNNIYTRWTTDGEKWSNWEADGATFGPISMAVFGAQLVQSVRGTDNNIYTRTQLPNQKWSTWKPDGATFSEIQLAVFRNKLYQAVRGTDNAVYIRTTTNPNNPAIWTGWELISDVANNNIPFRSKSDPNLSVFNNILQLSFVNDSGDLVSMRIDKDLDIPESVLWDTDGVTLAMSSIESANKQKSQVINYSIQSLTEADGTIITRSISNFANNPWWGNWSSPQGKTNLPIDSFSFGNVVIETVVGTDSQIYTRKFSY